MFQVPGQFARGAFYFPGRCELCFASTRLLSNAKRSLGTVIMYNVNEISSEYVLFLAFWSFPLSYLLICFQILFRILAFSQMNACPCSVVSTQALLAAKAACTRRGSCRQTPSCSLERESSSLQGPRGTQLPRSPSNWPFLTNFFGWEGSPTKIDYRKKLVTLF